jgi:hypothetical protein
MEEGRARTSRSSRRRDELRNVCHLPVIAIGSVAIVSDVVVEDVPTSGTVSLSACDDAASVVTLRKAVRGVAKALRLTGRAMLLRTTLENIVKGMRRRIDEVGKGINVVVELCWARSPLKLWLWDELGRKMWRFYFGHSRDDLTQTNPVSAHLKPSVYLNSIHC